MRFVVRYWDIFTAKDEEECKEKLMTHLRECVKYGTLSPFEIEEARE